MITFERRLNAVENGLSIASMVPGVGCVTGVIKVMMGLSQIVAGSVMAGISAGPAYCSSENNGWKRSFHYSKEHILHGSINMVEGTFESIPVIGTLHFISLMDANVHNTIEDVKSVRIITGYERKTLPYRDLVEKDLHFKCVSQNENGIALQHQIEALFRNKLLEEKSHSPYPSLRRIKDLAREAVNEIAE